MLRDGRIVWGSSYFNDTHTSAGGLITDQSEIYNPAARSFTSIAPMFKQRIDIGAQGLLDGTLLIAGGVTTSPSFPSIFQPTSEVYDPASERLEAVGHHVQRARRVQRPAARRWPRDDLRRFRVARCGVAAIRWRSTRQA